MQQFIHVHIIVIYSMIVVLNPYFKFCRQTFIYEKLLQFITVFMKLLLLSMQKTSDASWQWLPDFMRLVSSDIHYRRVKKFCLNAPYLGSSDVLDKIYHKAIVN